MRVPLKLAADCVIVRTRICTSVQVRCTAHTPKAIAQGECQLDSGSDIERGGTPAKADTPYQGRRRGAQRAHINHLKRSLWSQSIPIVVVGTKLDLVNEREVPRSTIQALSNRWDLPFYETSAKRDWHVIDVFEDLVRQMRHRYPTEGGKKKSPKTCTLM